MSTHTTFADCRKAIRTAKTKPTKVHIRIAVKMLKEMEAFIDGLEVQEPRKTWNTLARKARKNLNSNQRMELRQARKNIALTYIELPKEDSYKARRGVTHTPLEIGENETPSQAYRRMREERRTANI